MIFSQGKGPIWLDEGFAIYTSGELVIKNKPKELKNFLKYYSHEDEDTYDEVGFVVEGLIKKYGKEKVLGFLKLLPDIDSEESFNNEFEKYFEIGLEYGNMNKL
jgi:hypothetical protein